MIYWNGFYLALSKTKGMCLKNRRTSKSPLFCPLFSGLKITV